MQRGGKRKENQDLYVSEYVRERQDQASYRGHKMASYI